MLHPVSCVRPDVEDCLWCIVSPCSSSEFLQRGSSVTFLVYSECHVVPSPGELTCSILDDANTLVNQDLSGAVDQLCDDYSWQTDESFGSYGMYYGAQCAMKCFAGLPGGLCFASNLTCPVIPG
jgi:hypothetical protein